MVSTRFQRAARWLKYRLTAHALILIYHRVVNLPNDPFLLSVRPERFKEQMEVVREFCCPISLRQLVEELKVKKLSKRAVVVTFDDGYADNLYQAKPVLEQYEIPATVFITAGHLGSQREFWWDDLDRLFLQSEKLPNQIKLNISGTEFQWEAGEINEDSMEVFRDIQNWNIEWEKDPSPRYQLFRKVYGLMHSLPYRERERVLNEILVWCGAESTGRETHRSMTTDEVTILEKGGIVDIGAHTMDHSNLTTLPPDEQRQEIQQSKDYLESILYHPVLSFAYPYGGATPETTTIVRDVGFESSCATQADAVWPEADLFHLPRLGVRDWNRQEFTHWLNWWMQG